MPPLREAERRSGAKQWAPSCEGAPPAACGRQARLPALHRGDFLHGHRTSSSDGGIFTTHLIQAAFALPFIRSCPSHLRRAPHRSRTVTAPPGTGLRAPPAGAAIPAPPTRRHRKTPSVNGNGCTICEAGRASILIPSLQGLSTVARRHAIIIRVRTFQCGASESPQPAFKRRFVK